MLIIVAVVDAAAALAVAVAVTWLAFASAASAAAAEIAAVASFGYVLPFVACALAVERTGFAVAVVERSERALVFANVAVDAG